MNWKYEAMNYNPKHKIFPTNQEMNCIWKIIIIFKLLWIQK